MPQLPGRALAKLHIIPYKATEKKEERFQKPIGKGFWAIYNPTTFTMAAKTETTNKNVAGGGVGDVQFMYSVNRVLSVDLFIDGTGASPPLGVPIGQAFGLAGNASGSDGAIGALVAQATAQALLSAVTVTKYINYFFGIISATGDVTPAVNDKSGKQIINPDTHAPNYLKVVWGKGLRFFCQFQGATVKYDLFNQLGQPIRATISATFLEIPGPENILSNLRSPDLTKLYQVKAGDTLYNIAKKEYNSESFYLQIAQANDLKNYRKLVPGQRLILPPIAKTE